MCVKEVSARCLDNTPRGARMLAAVSLPGDRTVAETLLGLSPVRFVLFCLGQGSSVAQAGIRLAAILLPQPPPLALRGLFLLLLILHV